MKVGDRVKFSFAKKEKEGVIYKLFEKTAYIKVDFPKHKGKIIKRNVAQLKPA
ncbi:MAG: hypothetical protein NZ583_01455 [Desulfobacterota bacterium]|nr:hypothetical protein [Thermodesulfobacteriota bacterium]MDW8001381.1 hypothetical protein [Deltaproteobacteria bacterium]